MTTTPEHPYVEVKIPAFATAIGETMTVAALIQWRERIIALSVHTGYGPDYDRGIVEALQDVDLWTRRGSYGFAADTLAVAERRAASRNNEGSNK
jgi:hypothetical protein